MRDEPTRMMYDKEREMRKKPCPDCAKLREQVEAVCDLIRKFHKEALSANGKAGYISHPAAMLLLHSLREEVGKDE